MPVLSALAARLCDLAQPQVAVADPLVQLVQLVQQSWPWLPLKLLQHRSGLPFVRFLPTQACPLFFAFWLWAAGLVMVASEEPWLRPLGLFGPLPERRVHWLGQREVSRDVPASAVPPLVDERVVLMFWEVPCELALQRVPPERCEQAGRP